MKHDNDDWSNFDLNKLFRMMQEEFARMMRNQLNEEDKDIRPSIRGFQASFGPDGVNFTPIDDIPPEWLDKMATAVPSDFQGTPIFNHGSQSDFEEPYTEIHVNNEERFYQIVSEVPGVKTIQVEIDGRNLMFQGEFEDHKYKKEVQLKHELDRKSTKSEIRNGVLEILVKFK
ncbi:MAG: Hsp20/alpha crystallin family protein [Candidatus Kariarchaeaceae archaeon]|jgi:HSP20 family molecular chaperone IbpA